jgi:hypothetical protein
VVVLAPLDASSAATASPSPLAIILHAVTVGHGGAAASLTAPNGRAQSALVERAAAGDAPLALVSLHGTGTPLGDPIELAALRDAGVTAAAAGTPCALVANKATFGHTEGAAGVTGLLAAAAAAGAACVPPVARLTHVNAHVGVALEEWGGGRGAVTARSAGAGCGVGPGARLGASSFGMSGVNAHAVLSVRVGLGDGGNPSPAWRRARAWPAPPPRSLLGRAVGGAAFAAPSLTATPCLSYLRHHVVRGRALVPASALFDAGLGAARALAYDGGLLAAPGHGAVALAGAAIAAPLGVEEEGGMTVRVEEGRVTVASGAGVAMTAAVAVVATPATPRLQRAKRHALPAVRRPPCPPARACCAALAAPAVRGAHEVHPAAGDAAIHAGLAMERAVVVR